MAPGPAMEFRRWRSGLSGLSAPLLLFVVRVASGGVTLSFPGLEQATGSAVLPDAVGAAGPSHFTQFVNGGFAVYNKANGVRTSSVTDEQFWRQAGVSDALLSNGLLHPRIAYDADRGRWFATQITTPAQDNRILLAVSNGDDPSPGNWRAVSFQASPANPTNPVRFGDYPTLGLDANGVYVATENLSSFRGAKLDSNSLFSIPKSSLIGPAGPSLSEMTRFDGTRRNQVESGFIFQPVVDWAPSKGNGQVLAISLTEFDEVVRTPIAGSRGFGAAMLPTEAVSTQATAIPIPVRQPDGTNGLDPSDDRFASTVHQVNDLIYVSRQIGLPTAEQAPFPDHTGVRWTVLRVSDGQPTSVVAEGTIGDPEHDFFQPSIAANAAGDVVLVFNRSGPAADGTVNAFYSTGVTAPDGSISFGQPTPLTMSGVTDYHNPQDNIWGLYSSLTPDPSDPHAFWAVQEVPTSSSTWGTQITRIMVPEPSSVAAYLAVPLLLLSRRCHVR